MYRKTDSGLHECLGLGGQRSWTFRGRAGGRDIELSREGSARRHSIFAQEKGSSCDRCQAYFHCKVLASMLTLEREDLLEMQMSTDVDSSRPATLCQGRRHKYFSPESFRPPVVPESCGVFVQSEGIAKDRLALARVLPTPPPQRRGLCESRYSYSNPKAGWSNARPAI